MSFVNRTDLMVRVAGEKAQLADEFLTRSQLIPGTNITFDYLANYDIRINAQTGSSSSTGLRQMMTMVKLTETPSSTQGYHQAYNSASMVPGSLTAATDQTKFFGTIAFTDIVHNWELVDRNAFHVDVVEARCYGVGAINWVPVTMPMCVGVDNNRVRLWGTRNPANPIARLSPIPWAANADTKFVDFSGNTETDVSMLKAANVFYIVRLTEVIP